MPGKIYENYSELFAEADPEQETEDENKERTEREQDDAYSFIGNVSTVCEVTKFNFEQVLQQPVLFFYNILSFAKKKSDIEKKELEKLRKQR